MTFALAFLLVAFIPMALGGLCFNPPMEQQICSSPVAFKGVVIDVDEFKEKALFNAVTRREYKVKVQDVYRKKSSDLDKGDIVEIDAPGQMISTAIHMAEGEEYFILGSLEKDDDEKEIKTSFCRTQPFSSLTDDELRVIKGDYKCS